jgi:hypothetical protein
MELSKPLLANSGLKAVPALGELMLPSCGLRPSPRFIWRPESGGFVFPESLPVAINGSNLETQVMANPLSVCHVSRLCLPLPYLRCQHTFSASSLVSPHILCLCLPSPPWGYWDPASPEKFVAWYLMT